RRRYRGHPLVGDPVVVGEHTRAILRAVHAGGRGERHHVHARAAVPEAHREVAHARRGRAAPREPEGADDHDVHRRTTWAAQGGGAGTGAWSARSRDSRYPMQSPTRTSSKEFDMMNQLSWNRKRAWKPSTKKAAAENGSERSRHPRRSAGKK